jgi:hypothetical protein
MSEIIQSEVEMESQETLNSKLEGGLTASSGSTILHGEPSPGLNSDSPSVQGNGSPNTEKIEEKRPDSPIEVTWDGDTDPENPRNWPNWKKWYTPVC